MVTKHYLNALTAKIFKALPMRQSGEIPVDLLMSHLSSTYVDATGYMIGNPELEDDKDFQTVLNILAYLGTNEVDEKVWKREILKATNLLNKVEERTGGDARD